MATQPLTESPVVEQVLAFFREFDRQFRFQFGLKDQHLSDLDLFPGEIKGALFVSRVMAIDPTVNTYSNAVGNLSFTNSENAEFVKLQKTVRDLDISVVMTTCAEKRDNFVDSNDVLNSLIISSAIKFDHGLYEIHKRIEDTYPWVKEISVLSDTWDLQVVSHMDDRRLWVVAVSVTIRVQWWLSQFPDGRHYHLGADLAPMVLSLPNP